ncbi:MAG: hypothetical protein QM779_13975 [Propionicimonas sp.]|uniref:hypothetical protein n=1 Tax=Propionicimonas sp. TaxID=1955623 RepID=UPI003D0E5C6E
MSEETRLALKEAQARLDEASGLADELKQTHLEAIAAGIPDAVDALARAAAQAQPEVTKALGKEGVVQFRDELARASSVLAADVRGAVGKIKWPGSSEDTARNRAVTFTLYDFFRGQRVNAIAAIFRKHGYAVRTGRDGSQTLIHPYSLFNEDALAPLTDALKKEAKARDAVARAKAADDRDIVDDLWGDGPAAARLPGTPSREW